MYKNDCSKEYDIFLKSLKNTVKELKSVNNDKKSDFSKMFLSIRCINIPRAICYKIKQRKKKKIKQSVIDEGTPYLAERIAVYTSIYGDYDKIYEPLFKPNNIDYYIITDNDVPLDSLWKKIEYDFGDKKLSNIEKNRFVKINPHYFFQSYKYSIYIDSNIKILGDLTEMANLLGNHYIGFHRHQSQICVYDQVESCIISNRDSRESLLNHKKYLKQDKMPKNYGMVEANVIIRNHNDKCCIKLMDDWWNEFFHYSRRDQISLHHTLWKSNIEINDIVLLGNNVRDNNLLYVMKHGK